MGGFHRRGSFVCRTAAAFLMAGVSSAALAQADMSEQPEPAAEAEAFGLEEITVTARRVRESLQKTPVAVTAFSAETIDRRFALDIRGLAGEVPNVVITNVPGFNAASIGIRGQSTGDIILTFEPAVGVIIDDFVLAHVQTQLFDMFDIERIEVLRGPQGTLFGKNTVGGVVNVITKRPTDEHSAEVRLGYGNFDTFTARGAINLPITDNLFLRTSVSHVRGDGFYRQPSSISSTICRATTGRWAGPIRSRRVPNCCGSHRPTRTSC